MNLFGLNFPETFAPTMSAAQIVVHGTLIYVGLCVLLRIIAKRQAGKTAISALLFVVIIGEIAADAVSREAKSLMDFLLVLLTVMLLGYVVDWLAFRFRWIARLVQDKPTSDTEDPANVREEYVEADGDVSIVRKAPRDAPGWAATNPRDDQWRQTYTEDEEAARRRRRRRAEQLLAQAGAAGN